MVSRLHTSGGYRYDQTVSALQKMIRRGMEREAMYFAIELESKFPSHLWNRLITIANEDIGLADPHVTIYVDVLRKHYEDGRRRGAGLALANAILALCRAEKSRLSDHFQSAMYRTTERIEIPDVAFDKHTQQGRSMGRGWEHFLTEGVKLVPESDIPDSYREEAIVGWKEDLPLRYDLPKSGTGTKRSKSTASNGGGYDDDDEQGAFI
jgi:replication-associated recombination protein RarA